MPYKADMFMNWNPESRLFGIFIQQSFAAIYFFERFLGGTLPEGIIELGSGCGALSLYFAIWSWLHDGVFITADTSPDRMAAGKVLAEISRCTMGRVVACNTDVLVTDNVQRLFDICPSPRVIFCDNGDKPRELSIVSRFIAEGDSVVVHDYGEEVFDADIPESMEKFEPWHHAAQGLNARLLVLRRKAMS